MQVSTQVCRLHKCFCAQGRLRRRGLALLSLQLYGFAEILGLISDPSTLLAEVLAVSNNFSVFVRFALLNAKVHQVAEVHVVSAMGQCEFFHLQISSN